LHKYPWPSPSARRQKRNFALRAQPFEFPQSRTYEWLEAKMMSPFDVFEIMPDGQVMWHRAAMNVEEAVGWGNKALHKLTTLSLFYTRPRVKSSSSTQMACSARIQAWKPLQNRGASAD
jgi:hypothetical protein